MAVFLFLFWGCFLLLVSQCLSCCLSICEPFLWKNVPCFCAFLSLWMYPIQNRFKLAMVKIKRHSNLTEIWCHGWILSSKYYMLARQFWKQTPSKTFVWNVAKWSEMIISKRRGCSVQWGWGGRDIWGGGIPAILPLSSSAPPLKRISSGQLQLVQGNIIMTPGLMFLQKKCCSYFHFRSRDFVYLRATFSISFCFWVVWEAVGPSESDWRNLSAGKRMKLKWLLEQGEMLNSPQIWT